MRTNPILDVLTFLIGGTPDQLALGPWRYILVALFDALLAAAIVIAIHAWSRDPAQRTGRHVVIWGFRLLIGGMWFQGSLWKLPLPVAGPFRYWTGQLVENTWIPLHGRIVRDVLLPNIAILDPIVYCTEALMAASLLLGLAVRLSSAVAILFTLNIAVGLYHNQAEWPWEYVFIIVLHGFFIMDRAGRSLGLDAVFARRRSMLITPSAAQLAYRLAS